MKKKWIVVVVILICCLVYAIVKLSMSENQNMSENQYAYNQAEKTQSAKQTDAGSTDEAAREEGSGTPATDAQIEAVTKVFNEFLGAVKSKDYEQAWKLMSESSKSQGDLVEFKEAITREGALIMESIIRPESATQIDGRVRVRVMHPSLGEENLSFVQEDGQWKLD
ncbi:MAG TPA: hypothetical protein DIU00_14860 [Phycisphaerales bacterium]|nr:hypothetical protein [Phycisphaerales bacterium]